MSTAARLDSARQYGGPEQGLVSCLSQRANVIKSASVATVASAEYGKEKQAVVYRSDNWVRSWRHPVCGPHLLASLSLPA